MTDDTSTWLKKNPLINPMGRSLKTSLRFHVNGSEMDASIISNPGKVNDKQIFVPRLMQRRSLVTNKLNQKFKFKVPANVTAVNETVNETAKSKAEAKSSVCVPPRKSFLPVKNQLRSGENNNAVARNHMRASFMSRSSAKKNTSRRDLIQKFVDACIKNNMAGSVQPAMMTSSTQPVETTIIRSILKKQRASLRRTSQMSDRRTKPKSVKKVLFEGFENVCLEKEKETELNFSSLTNESDVGLAPLDETTVFLNLPKSSMAESSPLERKVKNENAEQLPAEPQVEPVDAIDLGQVLKSWRIYVKKVNQLKSRGNALRNCFRVHLEQSQALQDQFKSYVKSCEESFDEFSRIEKEMEENLMLSLENGKENETPKSCRRNSREGGKPRRENSCRIKISTNSKVIQKSKKKLKPLKSFQQTNNE